MVRHDHRDTRSGQFARIPSADLSVVNRSGDVQAEHAEPADQTVYLQVHREQAGPLRHHRVLVHDADTGEALGEVEPTVARALWPEMRQLNHLESIPPGDPVAEFLMAGSPDGDPVVGPHRDPAHPVTLPPAARGGGRARTRIEGDF